MLIHENFCPVNLLNILRRKYHISQISNKITKIVYLSTYVIWMS